MSAPIATSLHQSQPTQTLPSQIQPAQTPFRDEVLDGLAQMPKSLPCKYFYDCRGSLLFDAICELPEYYLMRTEQSIMQQFVGEMADELGSHVILIEFGSGSSLKTRYLLNHLQDPVAYVPVDISQQHLHCTARQLSQDYPEMEILPTCADFTTKFELPFLHQEPAHRVVYFPGSTIGNFDPFEASDLLDHIAEICGPGGKLLIGVDLVKDEDIITAAYNDAAGVTARFNLNLLERINRELDGNFDLGAFEHQAIYNSRRGRVEIGLVSRNQQQVYVGEVPFDFAKGELIRTEYSHKYTVEGFARLAKTAGWQLHRHWVDERQFFGVLCFANEESPEAKNSQEPGKFWSCK